MKKYLRTFKNGNKCPHKRKPRNNVPQLIMAVTILLSLFAVSSISAQSGFDMFEDEPQRNNLVTVETRFSMSEAKPGETYQAAAVVTIDPEWHINSAKPYQDWLIPAELSFDTLPGVTPHDVTYPDGSDAVLIDEKISVYSGKVVIPFLVTIDNNISAKKISLPVRFSFQPCNDKQCLPPKTIEAPLRITIGENGTPLNAELFSSIEPTPTPSSSSEEPSSAPTEENEIERLIHKYGFWGYFIALGLAFLTGLLLSFSPCTYPMIPITVSIFAGQQRTLAKGFILSLVYVGSMAVIYGIMGLIVSLIGGVFGAWLASPAVVIGIAIVFVIFSLSMFGLYELQVPSSLRQKLGTTKQGGGIVSSIVLGVVAALVVSPCVGPFVAGILLYVATSGSPVIGFLVLFVFALGLGTLYIIIGMFSSAISKLPGAGEWMESIKKFFGFVLLIMALYFLRTIISPTLNAILTSLVMIAFAVFWGGLDRLTPEAGFFLRLKKFAGLLALIVGVYLFAGTLLTQGLILPPASEWLPASSVAVGERKHGLIEWETNLEEGLARAKQEQKPVLIDTWATWCANCRVLEKKTFNNPRVAAEAKRFVAIKVQLENAGTEITKDFMKRFGMKHYSLPTTLLLDSSGKVKRILKGVIEPDDMIAEMQKVR